MFDFCQNPKLDSPDNNEMSGIIKGSDKYTMGVKKFMNAYIDNDMPFSKRCKFSKNAIFYVNERFSKLNIDDMIAGFSIGHEYFDDISENIIM